MTCKKVLLVPLNWGLGHASRLIPIISALKKSGAHVVIGGSPAHLSLIRKDFGFVDTVKMPYLNIRLTGKRNQIFSIVWQIPAFIVYINREHWALKRIIRENNIDVVISDNCYGLWTRHAYSIFITHQLKIKIPRRIKFLEKSVNKISHWFIAKFDECWVPDLLEDGGIAGELSHEKIVMPKVKYLGILSRFINVPSEIEHDNEPGKKKLLIIISGPENQRTIFENKIKTELDKLGHEVIFTVIRGLPGTVIEALPKGWKNHLPAKQMAEVIMCSDYIVCHSGYSSIMDLIALGRTAILVPTPGQPEQEYLAEYLTSKGLFHSQEQEGLDLKEGIRILEINKERSEDLIRKLPIGNCNFPDELLK